MKSVYPRKPSGSASLDSSLPHSNKTPNALLDDMLERLIRERAFQLYEQRGRHDGLAQQDWLQAEQEILRKVERSVA